MKRRLLFLPGAGGDPNFWRPLGDLLLSSWEKIYFEWPGLGNRALDPAVKCFDDRVSLVERGLGDGPVDILAQSMGGLIGARIAIKHADNICPLHVGKKLSAMITDARIEIVRGGDHGFVRDMPVAIIEAVMGHLE